MDAYEVAGRDGFAIALLSAGGGLDRLVLATLLCVGAAMLNAWVLRVEIDR